MALSTAFFTALSSLNVNSENLNVIGNNIANVNSPGFKASKSVFMSQFSSTQSFGTPPGTNSGGTNPRQIGLGVQFAAIQRNFGNGAVQTTGIQTNMAIEGTGFFVVEQAGANFYTRAGNFTLNRDNVLVDTNGGKVQGFGVDGNFNIIPSALNEITLPLGTLTIAEASRSVTFKGNVNASGDLSTGGSLHESRAFYTDNTLTTLIPANYDLSVLGNDLFIDNGAGGFYTAIEGGKNTVVTISGAEKAGKELGTHKFAFCPDQATADSLGVVNWGADMEAYATFLDNVLGTDNFDVIGTGEYDLGGSVTLTGGQLVVQGNKGTAQNIDIVTQNMSATNNDPASPVIGNPFIMSHIQDADGESVRTSFVIYDSLGTPLTADITFVLQDKIEGQGTAWEFIVESNDTDAADHNRVLSLGLVRFDHDGNYVSSSNSSFTMDRTNGAESPLSIDLIYNTDSDAVSSLTATASTLNAVSQDGSPIGTLSDFSIGNDGIVTGAFTNGLTRQLGQVALASYGNPEGLIDVGNNRYTTGPNSGNPAIGVAMESGAGRILAGAVELSNVDLAEEFVNLITASTGFTAASRVITTTDELIQQLLMIGR